MKKFGQHIRKLVPIKYRSTVIEDGSYYRCDWWRWLGHAFAVEQTTDAS